jgi:class 3 adenylate cyclase
MSAKGEFNDMNEDDIVFKNEDESLSNHDVTWKIMIVDDDRDIHDVTKFVLKNFEFENKKLQFYSAYSIEEARQILIDHPDISLILLDIVMEEQDSGLKFVKYIREDLRNYMVRIILRTGYPGLSPEIKVTMDYDINDYKEKTELTKEKFFSSIVVALRSYSNLRSLQVSLDDLRISSQAAERFILKDYLKILQKGDIAEVKLGDHAVKEMAVLFMDMSKLVSLNDHLTPDNKLELVNSYMKYLYPVIIEQNGFIETFIGEGIMALFYGPPDNAIKSSIAIIKSLSAVNKEAKSLGLIHIGIQSGLLTLGVVGSEERMDFTALGSTVQIASQLKVKNRYYHTSILVGEDVIKKCQYPDQFHYRWIANLPLHVNPQDIPIYEIFDVDDDDCLQLKEKTKTLFESGIKNYIQNNKKEAEKAFTEVLTINPQDAIAKLYLALLKSSNSA